MACLTIEQYKCNYWPPAYKGKLSAAKPTHYGEKMSPIAHEADGLSEFFLPGRLIKCQMMVVEKIVVLAWNWLRHSGINEFQKVQNQ